MFEEGGIEIETTHGEPGRLALPFDPLREKEKDPQRYLLFLTSSSTQKKNGGVSHASVLVTILFLSGADLTPPQV
jgi:hypothetical protein